MTTQSAGGAPAKRVKSVTSPTQITGNVARRVIPVTDGRAADGGAAEQVYYVATADLVENGGRFTVSGEQAIPVVNVTSGQVRGGAVVPVYDVTGQAEPNVHVPGDDITIGNVLRADAVAYWKMDEASGTRADSSSGQRNLTDDANNISSGTGKFKDAAIFNDASQILSNAGSILEDITSGCAVAFWFKIITPALDQDITLIVQHETTDNIVIEFENVGSGSNTIGLYLTGTGFSFQQNTCDTNQWNLFIGWYDSTDKKAHILLNNSTSSSYAGEGTVVPELSAGGFMISPIFSDSIGEFLIDEVLLLNRIPTQAECDYLWNDGAGRSLYP